jgi:hypothetical protein
VPTFQLFSCSHSSDSLCYPCGSHDTASRPVVIAAVKQVTITDHR